MATPLAASLPVIRQSKRVSSKVSAANLPGRTDPGRTFYVCDTPSGRRILTDSGEQLSVIPPTAAHRQCPTLGLFPQTVDTSPIATFDFALPPRTSVSSVYSLGSCSLPTCPVLYPVQNSSTAVSSVYTI
ncbi:hypothetical protein SprV_0100226400 [Sparganum proliferum]